MESTYNQLLLETLATFNNVSDILLFSAIAVGLILATVNLIVGPISSN